MSRDILRRLGDPTVVAIHCPGDAWPRALLSTTLIPDKWMALVEQADGRRRYVPSGEDPNPQRGDRLLLIRNRAITVPLAIENRSASCGNKVSGQCEILIRWQSNENDLAALRKTLMDQIELSLSRLAEAVARGGGAAALQQFVRQHPAEKLLHEDLREMLLEFVRAQMKRFVFDTGAIFERVTKLEFSSETLAHREAVQRETEKKIEQIKAREIVEDAARLAANRRLEGLSGILEKLKTASAADGKMQWHQLLPALSPAERARLLENLWRLTPDQSIAQAIVVVAGQECVWLDPARPEQITRRITLADKLGGLRSINFDAQHDWLLIGAAGGVWVVQAADGNIVGSYEVPGAGRPQTGFNAAVIAADRLFATHSQLGCWCWPLYEPVAAQALLRPSNGVPKAIRAVTKLDDDHILFAADDQVHLYQVKIGHQLGLFDTGGQTIHCLTTANEFLFVGTANGLLLQDKLDGTQGVWEVVHRAAGPVESVFVRCWNDLTELVIPAGMQGVCGIYAAEGYSARLMETTTPVRRAWACDDALVALNDHRDRLIVLHANTPGRVGRDVPLGRTLGRSVQDVCILTRKEGGGKVGTWERGNVAAEAVAASELVAASAPVAAPEPAVQITEQAALESENPVGSAMGTNAVAEPAMRTEEIPPTVEEETILASAEPAVQVDEAIQDRSAAVQEAETAVAPAPLAEAAEATQDIQPGVPAEETAAPSEIVQPPETVKPPAHRRRAAEAVREADVLEETD